MLLVCSEAKLYRTLATGYKTGSRGEEEGLGELLFFFFFLEVCVQLSVSSFVPAFRENETIQKNNNNLNKNGCKVSGFFKNYETKDVF